MTRVRAIRPLTEREEELAELVGRGLRVKKIHKALAERGRHLALCTLQTRIRDLAHKLDNPLGLPPLAIIRLYQHEAHPTPEPNQQVA